MKQVTYKGSTVIPTSSSLEMIQVLWAFFPENHDQFVEVSAEINGSLKFGILGLFSLAFSYLLAEKISCSAELRMKSFITQGLDSPLT